MYNMLKTSNLHSFCNKTLNECKMFYCKMNAICIPLFEHSFEHVSTLHSPKKKPATRFTVYGSFPNYTAFSPKKPTDQGRCVMSHSYSPSTCGYINFHNAWLWTLVFDLQKVNRLNGIGITSDRTALFKFTISNLFFLSIWVHNSLKNAKHSLYSTFGSLQL
jgi:hypothetical protein